MRQRLEIYRCEVCGNIVEILHGGKGQLVCCGQPMVLYKENTVDAATEKHLPVVETVVEGVKVRVGSVPHPMEESHYIQWIEIIDGDRLYREFLKPGGQPEAVFKAPGAGVTAREYCNLHGLWKS
jgi:superoxide reductase